jgi:hypothetical protein
MKPESKWRPTKKKEKKKKTDFDSHPKNCATAIP